MAVINLDPPKIDDNSDGISRYLYRLVEQLNYVLGTVDDDVYAAKESARTANNKAVILGELSEEEKQALRSRMLAVADDLARTASEIYSYTDAELDALREEIGDIETQIDARIETWAQNSDPSISWTTAKLREEHTGDLWLYTGITDITAGSVAIHPQGVYRYTGSAWAVYSSTTNNLFDLADGKTTVFYGSPSGSYSADIGDYLVDDTDGSTYKWSGAAWIKLTDYKTYADGQGNAAKAYADTKAAAAEAYTDEQFTQAAADLARTAQEVRSYTDSEVTQTKEALISQVSTAYVAKATTIDSDESEYSRTLKQLISSTVSQLSGEIRAEFSTKTELSDELSSVQREIATYIRASAAGIEIGKSDSPYSVLLSNEELQFRNNGVKVAYISGNKLYITSAEIVQSLNIGKFQFKVESDDGLVIKWVG